MLISLIQKSLLYMTVVFLFIKFNKWFRRERVDEFHKKSVFVTGTDHGFGKLLVNKLDSMGLKVYAGCYTEKGAEELRKTSSERVKTVMIDVTKRETIVAARDFIEKDLGPNEGLWGLVNNAGILKGILFDFCQIDDYRQVMEVNFFGTLSTTEIFLPLIKKSRGRIVNLSSVAGRCSTGSEPYMCSKHALEAYNDGLRRSMKTFDVHVAILEPGFFRTPLSTPELWKSEMDRTWNNLPLQLKNEYGQDYKESITKYLLEINPKTPFQSWNKPEHVINTITHALSSKRPKARYVVGVDSKILTMVFTVVPDWLSDFYLRNEYQYHKIAVKNQ